MSSLRQDPWFLVLVGLVATFAAGGLFWLGATLGLAAIKPLVEGGFALALLSFYPERGAQPWSVRLAVGLVLLAITMALGWITIFAWGNTRFVDVATLNGATIALTLASGVVTAPLFEEKVVRGLLLDGVAALTKPLISAVAVSVVFAMAHQGAVIWSFFVSMVLCGLALAWRINTFQRALVHGVLNLMVLLWYGTYGYGFFA